MEVSNSMSSETNSPSNSPPETKVVLSLHHVILPKETFEETPSERDGVPLGVELDLRLVGCELIQSAAILLKLPQTAAATAQVLFHRFYYAKSFLQFDCKFMAMAAITLAAKIEETSRRIRDVINVFTHMDQIRQNLPIKPLKLDEHYIILKQKLIKMERMLLKVLGFCVYVKHPHKIIVMYLQYLECVGNRKLVQTSWNYMNDSLRTDLYTRFPPEIIACACIHLSARDLLVPLPDNPAWYYMYDATDEHINDICLTLLRLYVHRPKPLETLEEAIEKLREDEGKEK
ncbi:hypothetical protein SNEBB_005472 [Seison nebaliae]|nr:hypothetical protein SNEBB_005472 [Seison nebaliae]